MGGPLCSFCAFFAIAAPSLHLGRSNQHCSGLHVFRSQCVCMCGCGYVGVGMVVGVGVGSHAHAPAQVCV